MPTTATNATGGGNDQAAGRKELPPVDNHAFIRFIYFQNYDKENLKDKRPSPEEINMGKFESVTSWAMKQFQGLGQTLRHSTSSEKPIEKKVVYYI